MKVVILAGGKGTRISEESSLKPKPMVTIGDKPIIWHIMKYFSHYGFDEFIVCCGYKSHVIKEYFANYFLYRSDVTFDYRNKEKRIIHECLIEPWQVTLAETGKENMTGSRIKQIQRYIPKGEPFLLTYGDGLSDVDIPALLDFHQKKGKIATITAVQPPAKFGVLNMDGEGNVLNFQEKPTGEGGWINGGFMVLNYDVFRYIDDDPMCIFEQKPLENLAKYYQLNAFKHYGFWHPMDTLRDKHFLEKLWMDERAPWKVWEGDHEWDE